MDEILATIERKLSSQDFLELENIRNSITPNSSGFYWIYTNLSIDKFTESVAPVHLAHIDFSYLATIHKNLKYVISQKNSEEFWCIYNGKGKELKKRILAEFSIGGSQTGKLALL